MENHGVNYMIVKKKEKRESVEVGCREPGYTRPPTPYVTSYFF